MKAATLALVLAFAPASASSLPAPSAPIALVSGGSIRGALDSAEGGAVFKGVPFAEPPVKNLRWREPQPVRPWKGIRDTTRFGAACIQNPFGTGIFIKPLARLYGSSYEPSKIEMSEDCLYLNVWTPEWPPKNAAPVMVWIHGGSNVMGSGSEATYNGAALARNGVVVVTINYRLGALGFFAHPALTRESPHHASGNYGLLDQIAALEWVQASIARLGGDPRRVTVFGESAGAIDAGLLLCSPLAENLVERAIMESGPVLGTAHHPSSLAKGERFGESVARALGAGDIAKLREVPPAAVIQAYGETAAREGDPGMVIDGWFLRASPAELFAQGKQLPVDVIVGNNGWEMSAFRAAAPKGVQRSAAGGGSIQRAVRMFYGGATPLVVGLFAVDSAFDRTEAADRWLNDVILACPEMAMATLNAGGHRAYVYQFLRSVPGKGQKALGSFHSLELPYLFGAFRLPAWSWLPFEPQDIALGESMRSYWTNFAATGNRVLNRFGDCAQGPCYRPLPSPDCVERRFLVGPGWYERGGGDW